LDILTGHAINVDFWNKEKEQAKKGYKDDNGQTSDIINRNIIYYKSVLNDIFARFEVVENTVPETEQVKQLFIEKTGKQKTETNVNFFSLFDKFIYTETLRRNWSEKTIARFKTAKKNIYDFDCNISLNISDKILENYIQFLNGKKLKNTTIKKEYKLFKWFLNWCTSNGYIDKPVQYNPKFKGTENKEIIYLTLNEIAKLKNKEFKDEKLEQTRDVFLFCCFTGLRYSDVAKLRRSDVKTDHITIVSQKTNDHLKIELNNHSKKILDKYKGYTFENQLTFPIISNIKRKRNMLSKI
jgi:integrase